MKIARLNRHEIGENKRQTETLFHGQIREIALSHDC